MTVNVEDSIPHQKTTLEAIMLSQMKSANTFVFTAPLCNSSMLISQQTCLLQRIYAHHGAECDGKLVPHPKRISTLSNMRLLIVTHFVNRYLHIPE